LSRAFGRRIEGLPEATRTALVVSAASDDDRLNLILRACGVLGMDARALDPAEAAGVIRVEGERLEFRHPLVRAVAYSDATPAVRRDAHRALAEALVDRQTEERWAWHRALAAVGPDEVAAGALELVGRRSTGRSSSAAARAFEQAAKLSVRDADRARRLWKPRGLPRRPAVSRHRWRWRMGRPTHDERSRGSRDRVRAGTCHRSSR
jgi:hypothetical protein